jgi:hypothetical protein
MHMMTIVSVLITLQLTVKDDICVKSCYINLTRWLVYLINLIVELDRPR